MRCHLIPIILFLTLNLVKSDMYGSKEWVPQTKGAVWPKVLDQDVSDMFFVVRPRNFKFYSLTKCYIMKQAFRRYENILLEAVKINTNGFKPDHKQHKGKNNWKSHPKYGGEIKSLLVVLTGTCKDHEYPSFDMDEEYSLSVSSLITMVTAESIWGILRGLETFSQLLYFTGDEVLFINKTTIRDAPRFKHRGLLLDTSRHYIPKENILRTLDAMSYNKLNVFHWHIVDTQSFPYQSTTFPELSEKGAWHPIYAVYGPADVKEIIEYAKYRGIRVLPEFDTPGHTASWGDSHKELLTPCYNRSKFTGHYGPLDVSKNYTYEFVSALLREVIQVFPEQYIHIGGDEVDFTCWKNYQDIKDFMTKMNISDYVGLEDFYVKKIINLVDSLNAKSIVWEEVFTNGVKFPDSTLVQVWKSEKYKNVLSAATEAGKNVLLSACYYLDIGWKWFDWSEFYKCDPTDFEGTDEQKSRVLGGEVALWAEFVTEYNIDTKLWPRASAGAERLWSVVTTPNSTATMFPVAERLEEHLCRMQKRGIPTQAASGPNYCL